MLLFMFFKQKHKKQRSATLDVTVLERALFQDICILAKALL